MPLSRSIQRLGLLAALGFAAAPAAHGAALSFSTFLGGKDFDRIEDVAVDARGNPVLVGHTLSPDFPGGDGEPRKEAGFVVQLDRTGREVLYTTILDSEQEDEAAGVALDAEGNAYVTGTTEGNDFPLADPFQHRRHCRPSHIVFGVCRDAFVTKLDRGGAIVYSTYLGGSSIDQGLGIAVDATGRAYVTGGTVSDNFPTRNEFQNPLLNDDFDVFLVVLDAGGSGMDYGTYLRGGRFDFPRGVAVDAEGFAYVTGQTFSSGFPVKAPGGEPFQSDYDAGGLSNSDAFVAKLDPRAAGEASLVYSTYLGGSDLDIGTDIAVDRAGRAFVAGRTDSADFPRHFAIDTAFAGDSEAFLAVLAPDARSLVYSTFLGGSAEDEALGVAVDGRGDAYVAGFTRSADFPVAAPLQERLAGGADAFLVRLRPGATASPLPLFSTFLGGGADETSSSQRDFFEAGKLALGPGGFAFVAGATLSRDFPVTAGAFDTVSDAGETPDGFLARIFPGFGDTVGTFTPERALFSLRNSNTSGPADVTVAFGLPGDQPLAGDFDGDGFHSVGVFRAPNFFLRTNLGYSGQTVTVNFGLKGDLAVMGDWDGDGTDTPGVFRNGAWFLSNGFTGGVDVILSFGLPGDLPVAGDWDGDGFDTVGVFRPAVATFLLANSTADPRADVSILLGDAGDRPVAGDWNDDGIDTVGIFRNGTWFLVNDNAAPAVDLQIEFGQAGDLPVAGNWDGDAASVRR